MESKFWLSITDVSIYTSNLRMDKNFLEGMTAAERIQRNIRRGNTIISVQVKNPRYTLED